MNSNETQIGVSDSLNSGQVFLWKKIDEKWYGVDGQDVLSVKENPFKITSLLKKQNDFFRKKDDMKKIIQDISRDKIVDSAVKKTPSLRLLRQDPFQCYISFIVSSNSNIQNIKKMLERLCRKFGKQVEFENNKFWLFPEPKILAKAKKKDLSDCGLGYRAVFVKSASEQVSTGKIDFDFMKKADYQTAKSNLLKVFGVGNKVADCIMLFSLEKLDAFPLDIWTIRILKKYYSEKIKIDGKSLTDKRYNEIHNTIVNYFGPYAGYSQQFLFKMERDLNKKKWL